MKINLVSDLHIDFDRARQLSLPGGKVLLLAGDLCEVGALNPRFRLARMKEAILELKDDNELRTFEERIPFYEEKAEELRERIKEQLAKYDEVYAVLGNHEHYGCNFGLTEGLYKEALPEVVLLENESVPLSDDVRLFGATLWTDLDKRSPFIEAKCSSWNDYVMTTVGYSNRKLQAKDTLDAFNKTIAALYKCASDYPDQQLIVMTHFSPSGMSVPPRFKNHADNPFFHSSLENDIINNANIVRWCHGHMHSRADYSVGQCRVICNSRGYVQGFQEERTGFDPGFTFEV